MSKEVKAKVKIQLPAGSASPQPPVGTALGPHGIQLMGFCKEFNDATKDKKGQIVPVIVTIYKDRSFSIEYKTEPVSSLIKKSANLKKGAKKVGSEIVGSITEEQVKEIAKIKFPDLNTVDFESACKIVKGSAKSIGVEIKK